MELGERNRVTELISTRLKEAKYIVIITSGLKLILKLSGLLT